MYFFYKNEGQLFQQFHIVQILINNDNFNFKHIRGENYCIDFMSDIIYYV